VVAGGAGVVGEGLCVDAELAAVSLGPDRGWRRPATVRHPWRRKEAAASRRFEPPTR
jgi:hypothetical protein